MKNTQRKWKLKGVDLDGNLKIQTDGRVIPIAKVICSNQRVPEASLEQQANAKLIASAPDLLNACKHLVSILGEENEYFYNKHIEAFNLGMEAIILAEDINHDYC